jgi:hypothetical protein
MRVSGKVVKGNRGREAGWVLELIVDGYTVVNKWFATRGQAWAHFNYISKQ